MLYMRTLLLMLILMPAPSAVAADVFVIGVEETHYLPHYSFEYGEYRGFAREVLDAFFTARGYRPEYRAFPVERLFHSLVDGQVDFKYPDNELWREDIKLQLPIIYSAPVAVFVDGVCVLPEHKGEDINQLKSLGALRGFSLPPWVYRIADGELEIVANDSFQGMVEQAMIGRVDGIYANVDVVSYLLRHIIKQPGALQFDTTMPYNRGHYRLSTLKHPEVIAEFNQWLAEHTDFMRALKIKYGILAVAELETIR
jgi:ABC-type amino acid transport substrate-binding protein